MKIIIFYVMKIHDQHVHSYYSFDSEQPIEEYLKKAEELGLSYFVLTDHCDLNYLDQNKDLFFDIDKQFKELKALQEKYPNIKILKGIEIGYKPNEINRINSIIKDNQFDLINFSLHESDKIDYYFAEEYKKHGIIETLNLYFKRELEAIESFKDYDVFCHLDYGFKTAYLIDQNLSIDKYENELSKIMKVLIKDEKALEINLKVQEVLPIKHTKYILNLYKSLGGKYLTLSSDAHELDKFRLHFDKYIKIIKDSGFDNLVYFVNRNKYLFKIS